jgi:hypothetical protein
MNEIPSVIVYRNPLEAALWGGMMNLDIVIWLQVMVVVIALILLWCYIPVWYGSGVRWWKRRGRR